jgi:glycosyltransferase involved in cell wall biosynthesis
MSYLIRHVDLDAVPDVLACPPERTGLGLIFWRDGRPLGFAMTGMNPGETIDSEALRIVAGASVAERAIALALEEDLSRPSPMPLPSLTVAICTKDRAARLERLLDALRPVVARSPFRETNILVVDNASVDDATSDLCAALPDVDYVFEPKAGLNFARNTALHTATGDLIAYLDDDVVVDGLWAEGLARAWLSRPDAGGFTGLVLPFRLDTQAQIDFERRGGFGRGFFRREVHGRSLENVVHPVGAGSMGAGCNMAFDRALLLALDGFDDALDTGAPLPGGGDLDIFYRVLRSERPMVYEPSYLVFHEHRETLEQLERQYWTWGLGFMAFLTKARRTDPELRDRQRSMFRWWIADQLAEFINTWRCGTRQDRRYARAEFHGGLIGMFGEYDRSQKRVEMIRRAQP